MRVCEYASGSVCQDPLETGAHRVSSRKTWVGISRCRGTHLNPRRPFVKNNSHEEFECSRWIRSLIYLGKNIAEESGTRLIPERCAIVNHVSTGPMRAFHARPTKRMRTTIENAGEASHRSLSDESSPHYRNTRNICEALIRNMTVTLASLTIIHSHSQVLSSLVS